MKTWLGLNALLILALSTGCAGVAKVPPANTSQQVSGQASDDKIGAEPSPVPTRVPTAPPTAMPPPTAVRTPAWIEIGRGTIHIYRAFHSKAPTNGWDKQVSEGKIPFVITQREDWYDSGATRGGEVSGKGTIKWTEEIRTPNCSWDAEATETVTITGNLFTKPQCRLDLKFTETGGMSRYTMVECIGAPAPVLTHDPLRYQTDMLWKKDYHVDNLNLEGDVWDQKIWWLRDPQADFYTGCSATPSHSR